MTPEQEEKLERIRFADRAYTEDDLRRADSHCPRDRRDLLGIIDALRSELAEEKAARQGIYRDANIKLDAANARAERLEKERDEARELARAANAGDVSIYGPTTRKDFARIQAAVDRWDDEEPTAEAQPPAEPTTSEAAAPSCGTPLTDGSEDADRSEGAAVGAVASGAAAPSPGQRLAGDEVTLVYGQDPITGEWRYAPAEPSPPTAGGEGER